MKDNHQLYVESAAWLGVPYRGGGNSKRGVDCSGLTSHLYKKVYHKKLKRNSDDQRTQDCHKVSKRNLREGDLVFFHNGRKKRIASHVGIYLKDNVGVRIEDLVIVTEDGCEVLTKYPKDLQVVE